MTDYTLQEEACRKVAFALVEKRGWTLGQVAACSKELADTFFQPYTPNKEFDQLVQEFDDDMYDGTSPEILRVLEKVAIEMS